MCLIVNLTLSDDESPENVDSVNLKIEEEDESRFETGADFEDGPVETDFLGDFKTELEKNRARSHLQSRLGDLK